MLFFFVFDSIHWWHRLIVALLGDFRWRKWILKIGREMICLSWISSQRIKHNAKHIDDSSVINRRVPAALKKYENYDHLIEKSWEIVWYWLQRKERRKGNSLYYIKLCYSHKRIRNKLFTTYTSEMFDPTPIFVLFLSGFCIQSSHSACTPSVNQCGCSVVKPLTSQSKIVGGFTALSHSWPWMGM